MTSGRCRHWSSLRRARAGRQQPVDPDRGADGRNFVLCAERSQQPVVTAAADDRAFLRRARVMRLEDEARVIIEIADEARREGERADVEPARRHEAEARIEAIENGGKIDAGRTRERTHLRGGLIGIGFDGEKILDELARCGAETPDPISARPVRESVRRSRRRCGRRRWKCRQWREDLRPERGRLCRSTPSSAVSTPV